MRVPLEALIRRGWWDIAASATPLSPSAARAQQTAMRRHGEQVQAAIRQQDDAMASFTAEHFPSREQVRASAGAHPRRRPTNAQIAAAAATDDYAVLDLPTDAGDFLTRPTRPSSDGVSWA